MMRCKTYIFKLTSGQMEDADRIERFWAAQHRMVCRHCRAFTHNDALIDEIVDGFKTRLMVPDHPDGDTSPGGDLT